MDPALVNQLREAVEIRHLHGANSPTSLEWWYFTGHLWRHDGQKNCENNSDVSNLARQREANYGIQSTFFLTDEGQQKGIMAHAAEANLNDKTHHSSERFAPFSSDAISHPIAAATQGMLNLTLGNWRLTQLRKTQREINWDLRFDVKGTEYLLQLNFEKNDLWFHGNRGLLQKTPQSGNFYYSIPFVTASGVRLSRSSEGRLHQEMVCGRLWFDHEIHVRKVMDVGWRWFGLTFNNNTALMFYQISQKGIFGEAKGELWDQSLRKMLSLNQVAITPGKEKCLKSGRCYPQGFEINFVDPRTGKLNTVTTESRIAEQEMGGTTNGIGRPYWEGSVKSTWTRRNQAVQEVAQATEGIGYIEIAPQESREKSR